MPADALSHRFRPGRLRRQDVEALHALRDEIFRDGKVTTDFPLNYHGDGIGNTWIGLDLAAVTAGQAELPGQGYATTATAGGTTTLNAQSAGTQVFTGSSNQTVQLPNPGTVPTTTIVPQTYNIINQSSGTLTVQSYLGVTLYTVPPLTLLTATLRAGVFLFGLVPLFPGYLPAATIATSGGTTTLTNASLPVQTFTGTSNQTVVLPNATTLYPGWTSLLINQSSGFLTVQDGSSSTIASVPPAATLSLAVTNIGSSAGTWAPTATSSTAAGTRGANWTKVSQNYTAFQAAATTKTITLATVPAGTNLERVKVFVPSGSAFAGSGVASAALSIGYSGANGGGSSTNAYLNGFSVFAAGLIPTISGAGQPDCENQGASWNITATLACNVNTNNLNAGHVDIWLDLSLAT